MYDNVRRQCISVHIRCMTMWGWHVTGSCRFDDDMWRSQAWPFLSETLTRPASVTYVTRLRTICSPLLSQQRWIPTLWLPCVTELQGAPLYNNIQPHYTAPLYNNIQPHNIAHTHHIPSRGIAGRRHYLVTPIWDQKFLADFIRPLFYHHCYQYYHCHHY